MESMNDEKDRRMITVTTDQRSRAVLPGHPDQLFIYHENEDGSIFLEPAEVVSKAQREYDTNPKLRKLLADAAASRTVRRTRRR